MDRFAKKIFSGKKYKEDLLLKFGFIKKNHYFFYETLFYNNQFLLKIKILKDDIETEITELETNEKYTLFLSALATGSFAGSVREEYEKMLQKICDCCFEKNIFTFKQTIKLLNFAYTFYGDQLEFLWENFSNNAILRRKDTGKWYAHFAIISKNKLGLNSEEKIEMVNLRADPKEIETLIDNITYFKAYHMNKKNWITIILDGKEKTEKLVKMIQKSFELATK